MRHLVLALVFLSLAGGSCFAGDPLRSSADRGVAWLLSRQQADGSFADEGHTDNGRQYSAAMTALVVLAIHEAGYRASPTSGEGRALLKAIEYLCASGETDPNSRFPGTYFGRKDRSRMYGHGMITCAIASLVPEIADPELLKTARSRVADAVTYTIASQNAKKRAADDGGWRYEGISSDSDISVSVWQLLALRAAVDHAEVKVPDECWTKAAAFVKRLSRSPDKQPGEARVMSYEFLESQISLSSTGAGVRALESCGLPHASEADACRLYIDQKGADLSKERWLYWSSSHCSHAMLAADPKQKAQFASRLADLLPPKQKANGSWHQDKGHEKQVGDVFVTALAVSALAPWAGKH